MKQGWWRVLIAICAIVGWSAEVAGTDEIRAWWIDGFGSGFQSQSEVNSLLGVVGNASKGGKIRDANCNTVIVEVRRRADVAYPSAMGEPYMSGLSPSNFNALQAMINAAHDTTGGKKRIEVHAWIVAFATSTGTATSPLYYAHNNPLDLDNYWMTLDSTGAEVSEKALDPGHPKALEYTYQVCMDLVQNFDIDGLHFDYIRFTGINQGYNPVSVARFRNRFPGKPDPIPYTDDDFEQWRRDQVSSLVRKVYANSIAVKPHIKISGAFVGGTPGPAASTRNAFKNTRAYYQYYSDWDSWLQEGIIDLAVPMNYFDQSGSYSADYVKWMNFEKDRKANRHVAIGPGVYLNSLSDAIYQILRTRDASPSGKYANGFAGYSYRVPFEGGTWSSFAPSLVSQVTPTWANIPAMPWKTAPTLGHLKGNITDVSDASWIDGATVTISGPASRSQLCDGTGFYAFIDLPPGNYTITVTKTGYNAANSAQSVTAGVVANKDFALTSNGCNNPTITNIAAQGISTTQATIVWTTNIPANSQVEYGTTASYGSSTAVIPALVTSHSVPLTGLVNNTTYHYRVISTPASGCTTTSVDNTFRTATGIVVPDIIIESRQVNGSLTPVPSYVEVGAWGDSTAKSTAGQLVGAGSRYATSFAAKTASFIPNIAYAGPYDVYATWGASSNGGSANFKVLSNNVTVYNQNWDVNNAAPYENQWNLLGQFTFNVGQSASNASVKIDGAASSAGQAATPRLMSDAVKFVFRGSAGDDEPPSVPGTPTAIMGVNEANLTWAPSTDNTAVVSYNIYKDSVLFDSSPTASYTDGGLAANSPHDYQVSALDAAGNESLLSNNLATVTLAEPPTPESITCNRSAGTWYPTSPFIFTTQGGFGVGTVAKYRVAWDKNLTHTWGSGSESDWTQLNLMVNASSSGSWYFHVRSYNSAGVANGSADFGPYNFDISSPTQPEVTDDGVTTSSTTQLHAAWTAVDTHSGPAMSEYRIIEHNGPVIRNWTNVGLDTSVTATGLTLVNGKAYVFEVRVTDNVGLVSPVGASDGITVVLNSVATIGQLKLLPDNTVFTLTGSKVALPPANGDFYICETLRSSGILVSGAGPAAGTPLTISGVLGTAANGERQITSPNITPGALGAVPAAMGILTRQIGGESWGAYTGSVGAATGLHSTGLRYTLAGFVTFVGSDFFYLDDGFGLLDESGHTGLRIACGAQSKPGFGTLIRATGVSSVWKPASQRWPMLKLEASGWSLL